jgi:hypothetical protein
MRASRAGPVFANASAGKLPPVPAEFASKVQRLHVSSREKQGFIRTAPLNGRIAGNTAKALPDDRTAQPLHIRKLKREIRICETLSWEMSGLWFSF